ncbi:MAG: MFS transporter [Streptosporangiales bacterium]
MADGSRSTAHPLRLTAPGVALIAVCYGLARFAYGLFVPAFRADFTLSATLLGGIGAGSYAGYCLAIVVSAVAVPRIGARAVATSAGVVATVGMVGVALAPNPALLATAVLVAGSSTGLASPPLAQALARWLAHAIQNRAQAAVNAGPGVGIALSGPVALLMVGQWRVAWLCFAGAAAAVAIWVTLAIPRDLDRGRAGERLGAEFLNVAADRSSLRLVAAAVLFGAASACTWTFGRDHVTQASSLSQATSILLWTVLGVSELAGVAAGDLITRCGLGRIWIASTAVLAAATAVLGLLPFLAAAAFASVAAFGAAYVTLTTVVFFWALRLHPRHTAASVAVGFLAIAVGQAIASPLAGLAVDHVGATCAFLAFAALAALAALTAFAAPAPAGTPEKSK